jgi:hypothetical protein
VYTPPTGPSPRQPYQSSSSALSSLHSKSIAASGVWSSVAVNVNVVSLLPSAGRVSMTVSGGDVSTGGSTVHSYSVGSSSAISPSRSVADTRKT